MKSDYGKKAKVTVDIEFCKKCGWRIWDGKKCEKCGWIKKEA